jgi:cytochrome b pre-mRNA-processing protein 3
MLQFVLNLFRPDPRRTQVATLYKQIADAARQPALYARFGIPDTLEGRFEALSLHMILALRGLRGKPQPADDLARDLTDAFFRDLDASLREMGVGDTAVPKRMKTLASAFYGRAGAYDPALDRGDEAELAAILGRNVLGGDAPASALARYSLAADRAVRTAPLDIMLRQGPPFPSPEAVPAA